MAIRFKDIKKDRAKREMYLDGFLHGTSGLPKRIPTYEVEAYEKGFEHGRKGKLKKYFEISKADSPHDKKIPFTRQKRKDNG